MMLECKTIQIPKKSNRQLLNASEAAAAPVVMGTSPHLTTNPALGEGEEILVRCEEERERRLG